MNKKEEISKLKHVLMEKIKKENDSRYRDLSSDEVMKIIIESSNKGKYIFWVIREYIKNNIQRFEDIESRCKQALVLFKNNLSKFENHQKQLNKISFQELESLVEPYQDVLTQNAIKRMNKEKIWSEIDVIYEGVEGRIYIPKTKEASVFLGQGTKWCTAATNNNVFDYYNEQGPLYIFVSNQTDKNGREIKYQLHFESGQFMNLEDQKVDMNNFDKFDLLDKLFDNFSDENKILKIIRNNLFFNLFSSNDFYKNIFKEMLVEKLKFSRDYSFLERINCAEICQIAAKSEICTLSIIPDKFVTQELCEMALMSNGYKNGFHYIPKKFKTPELCEIAVEQNPLFLEFVPDKLKTQGMCENAVKKNGAAFSHIPQKFQTKELLEYAIKNGLKLHKVPANMRT